jgi:hypothetical protein
VANRTAARLLSFRWEIIENAPYSADLSSNDYMFGQLKKFLEGERFISDDDVKNAVQRCFRVQLAEFYNSSISKLVVRWDKCLNQGGDYVEKLYFDFPVRVLLWLKKIGAKTFQSAHVSKYSLFDYYLTVEN